MKANDYQKEALRTAARKNGKNRLILNGVLGLNGEAGEVADVLKKHLFQGHELNIEELIEELGDVCWYVAILSEGLSEDVTEKYHNPADITLLRKAKDCLKQGIKQLEKYINYFEQTPEEDACIEMHETVLEIDKILGEWISEF